MDILRNDFKKTAKLSEQNLQCHKEQEDLKEILY